MIANTINDDKTIAGKGKGWHFLDVIMNRKWNCSLMTNSAKSLG